MPRFPVIGTGAALIAFGAVFSTISALNAVVIGSSRVAFPMDREREPTPPEPEIAEPDVTIPPETDRPHEPN